MIDINALESVLNNAINVVELADKQVKEESFANCLEIANRFCEVIKPDVLRARQLMRRVGMHTPIYNVRTDKTGVVNYIHFSETPINWMEFCCAGSLAKYQVCLMASPQVIAEYLHNATETCNVLRHMLKHWDYYQEHIFEYVKDKVTMELLRRAEQVNAQHELAEKIRKELSE